MFQVQFLLALQTVHFFGGSVGLGKGRLLQQHLQTVFCRTQVTAVLGIIVSSTQHKVTKHFCVLADFKVIFGNSCCRRFERFEQVGLQHNQIGYVLGKQGCLVFRRHGGFQLHPVPTIQRSQLCHVGPFRFEQLGDHVVHLFVQVSLGFARRHMVTFALCAIGICVLLFDRELFNVLHHVRPQPPPPSVHVF